jgi:GDP/UDP-N,N'-diacetylbacillosamine 2-epimerase (hydrolysing)
MMKCCIVTGSRAEYGLLKPVMSGIKASRTMRLQLLVTGMHLSPDFGMTFEEIEKDGFQIDEKVEMLLSGDTATSIIKSMGLGMIGYADAFARLQPDWVIVLGDRFEALAATTAAYISNIPIAHISGGEVTKGANDEAFRHSITKMSFLHFTAMEEYRQRVIQLGEAPERVFNVGALGLDNIRQLKLLSKASLKKLLHFDVSQPYALITYHPVTLEKRSAEKDFENLLKVLDDNADLRIIFTLPNADEGGRAIIRMIGEYVQANRDRVSSFTSLGTLKYLSLLKYAAVVIGNSSSGIVEAPSFRVPVVNIGDRQNGRIKAGNIIDVANSVQSINKGLRTALSPAFRQACSKVINPYGDGTATGRILRIIGETGKIGSIKKEFIDLV